MNTVFNTQIDIALSDRTTSPLKFFQSIMMVLHVSASSTVVKTTTVVG